MYIGDLRLSGFKQMLEYLFEEIVEECFESPVFEIVFYKDNRLSIKIHNADTKGIILRLEQLQTKDNIFEILGFGILISLSNDISIAIHDLPTIFLLSGRQGNFDIATSTSEEDKNVVIISFTADKEIFKDFEIEYEQINGFLRQFAYLNSGLKIISIDKRTDELQKNVFNYPTGVFKQLDYFISQQAYGIPAFRIDIEAEIEKYSYKIGISYSNTWPDKSVFKTYAGNTETFLGGSLNSGILEGLILAIKGIAKMENVETVINKKNIKEQLIVIAAVKGEKFNFEGSTKRKLGMPELQKNTRKLVCEQVTKYFNLNPHAKEFVLYKFTR